MRKRILTTVLAVLCCLFALSACGNKGDLVRPDSSKAAAAAR